MNPLNLFTQESSKIKCKIMSDICLLWSSDKYERDAVKKMVADKVTELIRMYKHKYIPLYKQMSNDVNNSMSEIPQVTKDKIIMVVIPEDIEEEYSKGAFRASNYDSIVNKGVLFRDRKEFPCWKKVQDLIAGKEVKFTLPELITLYKEFKRIVYSDIVLEGALGKYHNYITLVNSTYDVIKEKLGRELDKYYKYIDSNIVVYDTITTESGQEIYVTPLYNQSLEGAVLGGVKHRKFLSKGVLEENKDRYEKEHNYEIKKEQNKIVNKRNKLIELTLLDYVYKYNPDNANYIKTEEIIRTNDYLDDAIITILGEVIYPESGFKEFISIGEKYGGLRADNVYIIVMEMVTDIVTYSLKVE
jgi:hypothetical protein